MVGNFSKVFLFPVFVQRFAPLVHVPAPRAGILYASLVHHLEVFPRLDFLTSFLFLLFSAFATRYSPLELPTNDAILLVILLLSLSFPLSVSLFLLLLLHYMVDHDLLADR
jgi:hypothetical protein